MDALGTSSKGRVLLTILALLSGLLAARPIRAQAADQDGDGRVDYVVVGDWDHNGKLQDADIMGGLLALTDDAGTAELVAGVFELDPDNDGYGEGYGLTCDTYNLPHICIPKSGITLKGQGPGVTILRKGLKTPGAEYGHAQLIGLAVDGTTYAQSTVRISNVVIRDLSLETVGTCDPQGTNGKGIRFMDCDHCSAIRISCKHLNQACVDFARCTFSESSFVTAEYVGNYDPDGADPTCSPGTDQPALYLYTSDGFITEHTGHRDAQLTHVGGYGVQTRSDGTVERPAPWGVADYSFNSTQRKIAQALNTNADELLRYTGIAVPLKRTGPATGEITVEIRAVSAGVPSAAVIPGYAASDFTSHEAALLSEKYDMVLFQHRLTDGYPARLTGGSAYAVVLSYSEATAQPGVVHVQGDLESTNDTFTGGDASTYNGSVWSPKPKQDLNFSCYNGFHRNLSVSRITVNDVTGRNDKYGTCLNVAKTIDSSFSDITCQDAGVIQFGNNGVNLDTTLVNFSVTRTKPRVGGGWLSGLVLGPYGGRQIAANGYIANTPGSCVQVLSGAAEQDLNGVTLKDCGANGVDINNARRVTLNAVRIESAAGDGLSILAGAPITRNSLFIDNEGCAVRTDSLVASAGPTSGNVMLGNGTDGICVNGVVTTAVEWSARDLPYVLKSDVVVQASGSLTIRDATVVGAAGRGLVVFGALDAVGTSFTVSGADPQPGDWSGIAFEPGSTGKLSNVAVRYAGGAGGAAGTGAAVDIANASVRIDGDSIISDSAGDGVYVRGAGSGVLIADSTAANNVGSGIIVSGASPVLDGVQLIQNEVGVSYVDGAAGWLTRSTMAENLVEGVFVEAGSHPVLGVTTPSSGVDRGLNNLLCNPISVRNSGSQSLLAKRNWWGVAPPPANTVGPVNRGLYLLAESQEALRRLTLASTNGKKDVQLCWEDITSCRGYRVFRSSQVGSGFLDVSGHRTAGCFTDVGAIASPASYYYLVEVD